MSMEDREGEHQFRDSAEAGIGNTEELIQHLRASPAEEIITDLLSTLLSTARIKLGRRDARVFIDLCALTVQYAGSHLPADLREQVENALGQLRLGQVQAEQEVASSGEPEPNDLARAPTPPPPSQAAAASPARPAPSTSRLWVPGR